MTTDTPLELAFCRRCHYQLRDLSVDRCPECGNTFDRDHPESYYTLRDRTSALVRRMLRLRSLTLASAALVVVAVPTAPLWGTSFRIYDIVSQLLMAGSVVCMTILFIHVFLVARRISVAYAVSHTLLAVVLTPVLLLGVFLVPLLVSSDLRRLAITDGSV